MMPEARTPGPSLGCARCPIFRVSQSGVQTEKQWIQGFRSSNQRISIIESGGEPPTGAPFGRARRLSRATEWLSMHGAGVRALVVILGAAGTGTISWPREVQERGTSPRFQVIVKPPSWSRRWWKPHSNTRLSRLVRPPCAQCSTWWAWTNSRSSSICRTRFSDRPRRSSRSAAATSGGTTCSSSSRASRTSPRGSSSASN